MQRGVGFWETRGRVFVGSIFVIHFSSSNHTIVLFTISRTSIYFQHTHLVILLTMLVCFSNVSFFKVLNFSQPGQPVSSMCSLNHAKIKSTPDNNEERRQS